MCHAGEIVFPEHDTENYLSLIGLLDQRTTLYTDTSKSAKADSKRADTEVFPNENHGARSTADVMIMAAKLAYENPAVIQKVVEKDWKMEYVKFFNCWNGEHALHPSTIQVALTSNGRMPRLLD